MKTLVLLLPVLALLPLATRVAPQAPLATPAEAAAAREEISAVYDEWELARTSVDKAAFERMLDVNLTSVFLCLKYEILQMETQGGGAIVNTSSASGVVATPGLPHYTAAKHGVLGLTKSAALEYNNKSIRVNAVCPGMVDTPLTQEFFDSNPKLAAAVQRLMPGGKLGRPTQVAEAVVWLCSEHSSWVSGLSMVIDGGYVNR